MLDTSIEKMIQGLNILIVDGNPFMRRLTRNMLMNLGAKSVLEAVDGLAALEAIRTCDPDVMLLDWDMPVLNGMEVMRIVRSPGVFPRPNLPIIMLSHRAQRSYIIDAHARRRARISAQADLAQGAARPADVDRGQAAADDEARQILRADPAPHAAAARTGEIGVRSRPARR